MAVPGFQEITLPLLRLCGDQREHLLSEAIETLASGFRLTQDERRELLPSGRQARFANRVGWARTYLTKSGLLQSGSKRGSFSITSRGTATLANPPETINIAYLKQFPEYLEFASSNSAASGHGTDEASQVATPEEILESGYQQLRADLAQDLLAHVKSRSPAFFENLVVDLLVTMGYGGSRKEAGERIGRSGDGGIDGIIKEDRLGLDVVYIQAKRWEGTVGRPTVQAFAGSLEGHRARKGVLITTSKFSEDALDYVRQIEKRIVLMDGDQLTQYMIDHNVGVAEVATYAVKRVALDELDYFDGELEASSGSESQSSSTDHGQ